MIHSTTGLVHICSALLAMLLGAIVLLGKKGTTTHKRIGYGYVGAMGVLNVTAFLIYDLFGHFGPFHIAALISSGSIVAGMVPVLFRHRINGWLIYHYYFMNWSVVGLYAAFWAETLVRAVPMRAFWPVVMIATLATTVVGAWLIRKNKDRFIQPTRPTLTDRQPTTA
ncbi:hypothetical protein BN8_01289 [Fibrisoma limi BUZ 3]|uniref:DUF2306 domain-containing protein n=1 Tax=Fibrisoma limi BUZ 3 TaxID=1185876 RepID=I2GEH5_9BACT|nr:DUF2306 domain-containing protein [Fibrisoma limi]CCH52300.1 hypothetical protein BN8_01289 [Fibrisoma limi BUZ 3]